jgi:uncharacterized cupredoxin-like copper-binding protein
MHMRLLIPLTAAAILAAGCGGDDNDSADSGGKAAPVATTPAETTPASSGGGETLNLQADPGGALKFDKTELTAKAGKVTIVLKNPSSVPHAIELEGNGIEEQEGETVTKGGTSTVSADLKPGKYEYYCPVDGHKDAGMEGDLTVT